MNQLRVCHIIHGLAPGGAEQLLVELARTGPSMGLDISVLSLMPVEGRRFGDELRAAGANVLTLGLRTRWDPGALPRAARLVRDLEPAILHTHLKHADLVGAYASRRTGVPMVSTLHRIEDAVSPLERFKRAAGARARLSVAARTITVSNAQRRWYLDTFHPDPDRVITIHNGIRFPEANLDAQRQAVRAELGVDPEDVVVTMLGVMRPGKGHAELIEAAAGVGGGGGPPVAFVLAGDGPLRPELEARARRLVPPARVIFPGWRSDVDRLLAGSDVVAHPTLADAFPTALLHALAAGLPVVASDVGGVPEIVTPETGMLVPPGDTTRLAAAVAALAGDPARRSGMGTASRDRFERLFSADVWVANLKGLYEEVVAR